MGKCSAARDWRKAFNSLQFPRHEHILASFRAAAAGMQTATTEGPENVVQNLSRSARLTMVMAARNGEAKADIAAKNLECLNEEIKIQGAAPKFATPNVGRLDRADHVLARVRRPEGR